MILDKFAVILAGGEGHRAGGNLPKQFVDVNGRPLVWWAIKAFRDYDPGLRIMLVVHPGFFDDWDIMFAELPEKDRIPHTVVCGGRSRAESVYNGLTAIREIINGESAPADNVRMTNQAENQAEEKVWEVAIHDGARPNLKAEMIRRGFDALNAGMPGVGVVPAIECTNSLRELTEDSADLESAFSRVVDRSLYVEVQTPQIFRFDEIMAANEKIADKSRFTDDASIAEAAGMKIRLYRGSADNIKVTHPLDFEIARILLK